MSNTVTQFLKECSTCGQCQSACPFLDEYGNPGEIISQRPHLAFLCTNCTGCDRLCPLDLSPAEALFRTKEQLIEEGRIPKKAATALRLARSFAERGHKTPFIQYPNTETVFWPGCSLAGTSPETVKKTTTLLSELLGSEIGIALDCCFDPLYQMGDTKPVREACIRIRKRFENAGIKKVIVGCLNCQKVFREYLPELKVHYVLELLPDGIMSEAPDRDLYLHHPCPFYRFDNITEKAKNILLAVDDNVDEQEKPACCGLGGNLNNQSPDLFERFTERVTMDAYGASIVTSCMGCKNTFLRRGRETYHILELITGVKPVSKPVSSLKKWTNRLILARKG